MEHRRAAKKPRSYPDNALGKHYERVHSGMEPLLAYEILDVKSRTTGTWPPEYRYFLDRKFESLKCTFGTFLDFICAKHTGV